MEKEVLIRDLKESHYSQCFKIYEEGILSGIATFETKAPTWKIWNKKFLKDCRYVAIKDDKVLGWIAITPFSSREVYRGVAEVSLYISKSSQGQGVGKLLLSHLIEESLNYHYWTLQAKIFPANVASLHLFKKVGFRVVGIRKKIAKREGLWYDNILLERRSEID